MILAIDFNKVIHDKDHPVEGRKMGPPMEGSKRALNKFKTQGHIIYIYTDMARTTKGYQTVEDWLNYYDIPWDFITNSKPENTAFFIDDKAIRFEDWNQTMSDIIRLSESDKWA